MTEHDRSAFAEAIGGMASTFGREIDEAGFVGYWAGLCDLSLADVRRAVVAALRTSRFMPSIAELRELAGELPPATLALMAWDAFVRAVEQYGSYNSVRFDDPALTATIVSLGGWEKVCSTEAREFDTWLRKDFERIYRAHLGRSHQANPTLLGLCDRQNGAAGFGSKPPLLITTGASGAPRLEGQRQTITAEVTRVADALAAPDDATHPT